MGIFGNQQDSIKQAVVDRLESVIRAAVKTSLNEREDAYVHLDEARKKLRETQAAIEKLNIERDRINETHARERREIEHKVGLEKIRQEQELALAKREATVAAQESNLKSERDLFTKQMAFVQEHFDEQFKALNAHMAEITKRLPTVTWDVQETRSKGAGRK